MAHLSERVKTLRKDRGWTQDHLASVSGLSLKTIQRIETGKSSAALEAQQALAQVFDLNVRDLRETPERTEKEFPPREYILEIYYQGECIEQQIYTSPIIPPLPGEQIYIIFENKNYSEEHGNWWLVKKRRHLKFNESINIETLMLTCVPDINRGKESELY